MSAPCKLSPEARQLVRDIVAGLEGHERHREYARVRSKVARMDADQRRADNARNAAHGREAYHADLTESRQKSAAKQRKRVERLRLLGRPVRPLRESLLRGGTSSPAVG